MEKWSRELLNRRRDDDGGEELLGEICIHAKQMSECVSRDREVRLSMRLLEIDSYISCVIPKLEPLTDN